MTSDGAETLTSLVATRMDKRAGARQDTLDTLHARCIDPSTGYQPSRSTVWKISRGDPVKVSPDLVAAMAAGLGLPRARVQAAAAFQYTGYRATEHRGATFLHTPETSADATPKSQAVLDRWEKEEAEEPADCNGDPR